MMLRHAIIQSCLVLGGLHKIRLIESNERFCGLSIECNVNSSLYDVLSTFALPVQVRG